MNIPDTNSNWETIARYALTFNGYHFVNGGPVELALLWDKVSADWENATVDELRACLFFVQRSGRFCGDEGSSADLEEARSILELLRAKNDQIHRVSS